MTTTLRGSWIGKASLRRRREAGRRSPHKAQLGEARRRGRLTVSPGAETGRAYTHREDKPRGPSREAPEENHGAQGPNSGASLSRGRVGRELDRDNSPRLNLKSQDLFGRRSKTS